MTSFSRSSIKKGPSTLRIDPHQKNPPKLAISFTGEQAEWIADRAKADRVSWAEIVRRAVDLARSK